MNAMQGTPRRRAPRGAAADYGYTTLYSTGTVLSYQIDSRMGGSNDNDRKMATTIIGQSQLRLYTSWFCGPPVTVRRRSRIAHTVQL